MDDIDGKRAISSPHPPVSPADRNGNGHSNGAILSHQKKLLSEATKRISSPIVRKVRLSVGTTPKSLADPASAPKPKSSTKKSATPASAALVRKRKIADLDKDVEDLKLNLDKMRKDKLKLQRTIEEQIKYPVRDDLIVSLDVKGKQPQPLPEAMVALSLPDELTNDAIRVWDFLNNFRKQMSLNSIAIDPLIELLKFTGRASPALTELFCAPLRLLLSDSQLAAKLSAAIPRRLNFANRSQITAPLVENGEDSAHVENEADFDTAFNGVRLLPRRLRAELVDPLSWQGVLRAVLLRLEPVKQLRRAAADVPEDAPIPAPSHVRVSTGDEDDKDLMSLSVAGSSSSSSKSQRRLTFSATLEDARGFMLSEGQEGDSQSMQEKQSAVRPTENRRLSNGGKKRAQQVNKDNLFLVTSDPRQELSLVLEAAILLETKELHCLSIEHKLAALKTICDACYDTQRLTELLASNADERADRVSAMSKLIREEKAKTKEVSVARSAIAIEKCKEINRLANAAVVTKVTKGGKAGKPKAKAGKDNEPTSTQVAAMLEEMALLERLGVDEVVESLAEEEPLSDEEEEDNDYTLNPDGTYTVRNRASVRGKANDRKRQRVERESRLIQVNLAKDSLERGIATGGEKEVRLAIRQGVKAGFRGRNEDGSTYCTELLKQVYKLQASLESKAKEEKALSHHEKELSELCVRSSPLGSDRFHRRYWLFPHSMNDESRVFVECDTSLAFAYTPPPPPMTLQSISEAEKDVAYVRSFPDGNYYAGSIKAPKPSTAKSCTDRSVDLPEFIVSAARDAGAGSGLDLSIDQPLCRLIGSRPSARVSRWSVYSANELWALCEALDDRGERERELKAAIRSHFDISEPPVVFLKEGNEYIGKVVLRTFGKKRRVRGLIVGWLPALGDDCALWQIHHSDGDVEDLELHEILESMEAATEEGEGGEETAIVEKRETRAKSTDSLVDMTTEEDGERPTFAKECNEEDEPDLVAYNRSIVIGNQGVKPFQIGIAGLRQELMRCQILLLDGLKRRGSSYCKDREGKRAWENSVKAAEELSELRSAVQELEAVVRSVQKGEDENDEIEAAREKAEARAVMLKEGWRFEEVADITEEDDNLKEQLSFIGKRLRRFFKGHGRSDGIIVGYLPSNKNEGMELWRMEHQDGDEEDLDREDVLKSIRWFEENLFEDDEAEASESDEEEEDPIQEDIEEVERAEGDSAPTLWPTAGVRARWLDTLQRSRTVSEVAMALSTFIEHSRSFGIMDEFDQLEGSPTKGGKVTLWVKSKAKAATPVPGASPYRRKGKSSVSESFIDGGRATRAASRRILSYAE